MATRKSVQTKKRSPKKRKPKVKLDNKKVMALAAVMIFICALVLVVTFMISGPGTKKSEQKSQNVVERQTETPKTVKEKAEKRKEQKSPENKKSTVKKDEPKVQPEKKNSTKVKTEPKKEPKAESEKTSEKETKSQTRPEQKKAQEPEVKKEEKTQTKTEQKVEPKKAAGKFNIPESSNRARLCFIIDDGGQSTSHIRKYTTLPFPVAIAVLPRLPATKECARIVVSDRKELMLHQPMQAQNLKMNPGPGAILPDMGMSEVYATVSQNLAELGPDVKGFNNHEGSLITCDLNMMGAVLDAAHDNNVYFVDSRTSKDTMAPFAALERDMKILEREVFIDDVIDRGEMLKQIMRGIDIANKKGKVIMIGHVDKSAKILPQLLSELYPELKAKGYQIVFPSQLL